MIMNVSPGLALALKSVGMSAATISTPLSFATFHACSATAADCATARALSIKTFNSWTSGRLDVLSALHPAMTSDVSSHAHSASYAHQPTRCWRRASMMTGLNDENSKCAGLPEHCCNAREKGFASWPVGVVAVALEEGSAPATHKHMHDRYSQVAQLSPAMGTPLPGAGEGQEL